MQDGMQVNKVTGRKITTNYLAPDAVKTYTRTFVVRWT